MFVLVYHLDKAEKLFRRYPAVDGSFYFVAGAESITSRETT